MHYFFRLTTYKSELSESEEKFQMAKIKIAQ